MCGDEDGRVGMNGFISSLSSCMVVMPNVRDKHFLFKRLAYVMHVEIKVSALEHQGLRAQKGLPGDVVDHGEDYLRILQGLHLSMSSVLLFYDSSWLHEL